MKNLILVLLVSVVAAVGFSTAGLDRRIAVTATVQSDAGQPSGQSASLPLKLGQPGAEILAVAISGYGADHTGVLHVSVAQGSAEVIVGDEFRATYRHCDTTGNECRIVVRTADNSTMKVRILSVDTPLVITDLRYEPVTAKRHAAASGGLIFAGFGVLLLFGPVFVWLRQWPWAEQGALVIVGLSWIAFAGPPALIISVAFVLAGYIAVRVVAAVSQPRSRTLVAVISGVILLVVLIKFATPVVAQAFLTPGGIWLPVPLGISYLAIRVIDLLLTAHARALREFNLRDYLAFVLMPYTLPAGPIQLYSGFLKGRIASYSSVDFIAGATRMSVGVAKKLIADGLILPHVTHQMSVFLVGDGNLSRSAVIMLSANLLYIYLDFSAYCDLAIGAARAGGRRLPENFDWPLLRTSVRQYWRHWHMTLSQWVMRRIYFPAFLASRSTGLSMFASMLAIGLWHAPTASWSLWALHHSIAMTGEARLFPEGTLQPTARWLRWIKSISGWGFMLGWVALGHSFTLFASPQVALTCYLTALSAPWVAFRGLVT